MKFVTSKYWWAFMSRGLLAVLFGLFTLLISGWTLRTFAWLFAFYALFEGLLTIIPSVGNVAEKTPWAFMFEGITSIVVGIFSFLGPGGLGNILWPDVAAIMALLLVASWAVVRGMFEILVATLLPRKNAGKWALGLSGLVSISFGGLIFVLRPAEGVLAMTWFIGLYALIFGAFLMFFGFKARRWHKTQMV
jgi:uncharacterized membrane protein HdeD (DUF308 family)